MNTQGWIRGYIAYNSPVDKFLEFVIGTIGKEFEVKTEVENTCDKYILKIGKCIIEISEERISELQKVGPYALDKFILDFWETQGYAFEKDRSQYTKYCYGKY